MRPAEIDPSVVYVLTDGETEFVGRVLDVEGRYRVAAAGSKGGRRVFRARDGDLLAICAPPGEVPDLDVLRAVEVGDVTALVFPFGEAALVSNFHVVLVVPDGVVRPWAP